MRLDVCARVSMRIRAEGECGGDRCRFLSFFSFILLCVFFG